MSFPKYDRYKDSGVEWLGEVPEHWDVKRLRFIAMLNPSKSEVSKFDRETVISFLPMEAIGIDGTINLEHEKAISEVETGYTFFREGDVTIAKITPCFENGKGAVMKGLLNGIGFGTTELIVARPETDQTFSEYLHWIFTSAPFRNLGESYMYGAGGQKRVPDDFVQNFSLGLPPLPEQRSIAAFLDRETTKIDELIAEQRQLIDLLKEKRQAVISHAVTKGLNPDAPMKDSAIEWLGEVPEHWEVKSLKKVSPEISVGIVVEPSKYYESVGVPALRSLNVQPGIIKFENLVFISEKSNTVLSKSRLHAGDLVSVRSGKPGTTAIIPSELEGCNCIDLIIIRKPKVDSEKFLCWYLNSDSAKYQFSEGTGGAIQQHFNIGTATQLVIPTPPLTEQIVIADFLYSETEKYDELIAEAHHAIALLQERRTALISAAVTGKIDVHSLV